VVEYLSSKHKTLSLNPSTGKKKKKRKKELIGLINAAPASILPLSILKNSESKPDPKLSNKELCHSQGFHFLSDCAQTRPSS
jgi:hypothetical protein